MSAPFNERGGESLGGVGGGETPLPGFRGGALGGFEWLRRRFARSFTQVEWELISRGGESIDEVGGRGAGRGGRNPTEAARVLAFRRQWSLKEAFVKARGDGLAYELRRVEFLPVPSPTPPTPLRPAGGSDVEPSVVDGSVVDGSVVGGSVVGGSVVDGSVVGGSVVGKSVVGKSVTASDSHSEVLEVAVSPWTSQPSLQYSVHIDGSHCPQWRAHLLCLPRGYLASIVRQVSPHFAPYATPHASHLFPTCIHHRILCHSICSTQSHEQRPGRGRSRRGGSLQANIRAATASEYREPREARG